MPPTEVSAVEATWPPKNGLPITAPVRTPPGLSRPYMTNEALKCPPVEISRSVKLPYPAMTLAVETTATPHPPEVPLDPMIDILVAPQGWHLNVSSPKLV